MPFVRAACDVVAGREGATGPADHRDANRWVGLGRRQGVEHVVLELARDGVELLGPVKGDAGDAILNVEKDGFIVGHGQASGPAEYAGSPV